MLAWKVEPEGEEGPPMCQARGLDPALGDRRVVATPTTRISSTFEIDPLVHHASLPDQD